jgi:hypothetical protein
MRRYAIWNFCAAAGGSLRDGGEKLGGALLAVLFGSHGLTSSGFYISRETSFSGIKLGAEINQNW